MNDQNKIALIISKEIQKSIDEVYKPPIICPKPFNEPVIDSFLLVKTRGYIENIVNQINTTYKYACYDACNILIRKLIEILIIEVYETNGFLDELKDVQGNIRLLNEIINYINIDGRFNIDKKTKQLLKLIKNTGDNSAHVRRHISNRNDVDKIININLRVGIEELKHLCKF